MKVINLGLYIFMGLLQLIFTRVPILYCLVLIYIIWLFLKLVILVL